ncbi:MAG: DUF177 domain-containing protein [Eubacteriales bacterium]|nr:DUF177 domain-containing protein [Eubacteriales bacterium]
MLDLSRILNGEINEIAFEEEYPLKDISDDVTDGRCIAKGSLVNHSGYLELTAVLSISYTAVCARCGEKFKSATEIAVSYPVTDRLENADKDQDEYLMIESGKLDMESICISSIILNLPTRFLCTEECKGLCSECGKNLNTDACSCGGGKIDPRMEKLKDYFNKQ